MSDKTELTAEEFLLKKLENKISFFGDGNTEFHTRELTHLLKCFYEKNQLIEKLKQENEKLRNDLLDALDLKSGHGPTALSILSNELKAKSDMCDKLAEGLRGICASCDNENPENGHELFWRIADDLLTQYNQTK